MRDKNGVTCLPGDTLANAAGDLKYVLLHDGQFRTIHDKDLLPWTWPDAFVGCEDRYEVVCRADGSDPRQEADADRSMERGMTGFDPYRMDGITAALRLLHQPPPRQPHELYAEFHRVVMETVKREAPKVRVVTDFALGEFFLELSLGEHRVSGPVPFSYDKAAIAREVVCGLRLLGEELLK